MQESNFKDTIVLKNLPSNIIDEAIIVLKQDKKAWELKKIENSKENNRLEEKKRPMKKDYVVKEAEMIVADYVKGINNKKKQKEEIKNKNIKYNRLKKYAYISTAIMFLQLIANLIK